MVKFRKWKNKSILFLKGNFKTHLFVHRSNQGFKDIFFFHTALETNNYTLQYFKLC